MSTQVPAIHHQDLTPTTTPAKDNPTTIRQRSLVAQIVNLAIANENTVTAQMNTYRESLEKDSKAQKLLSSLEAALTKPDNNGKTRNNNTPLSTEEKKLIQELKEIGVKLPTTPTTHDIKSAKEELNLNAKHTYQKADGLIRNKSSLFDIAKEIMKMVNRSIFGIIDRMNQR